LIEKLLILLVLLMSLVFLATLIMVGPSPTAMLNGLLVPRLPTGSLLTVIALIGTTVVPYNLFLHASAVQEKWPAQADPQQALKESRVDTGLSIGLGGLITLAVMSTAAAAFFGTNASFSAINMAQQLEPLLGANARYFFAAGLFAAGLSSAVTAPLAAAYAVCGALGWSRDMRGTGFRLTWLTVLVSGTTFAALGTKPLTAILFAQAANGFLLPILAIFLLVVMNRSDLLGRYVNRRWANGAGALVGLVTLLLGGLKILRVLGVNL
jgi:manganese transport protein